MTFPLVLYFVKAYFTKPKLTVNFDLTSFCLHDLCTRSRMQSSLILMERYRSLDQALEEKLPH